MKSEENTNIKWICVQRGAREHYAIPRALHRRKRLEWLLTEFYAPRWLSVWGSVSGSASVKRLAGRWHPELVNARVKSWNIKSILRGIRKRQENVYHYYLVQNEWLTRKCVDWLKRNIMKCVGELIVFSYSGTALGLFQWAKSMGARTVLGAIDPGRVEQQMVREEATRWRGWERKINEPPDQYNRHREEEYRLADIIVANSRWSFEALAHQGVPDNKIRVIPLCYEIENDSKIARTLVRKEHISSCDRPFTVLFLGQVILRKGIQYLIEAARHPGLQKVAFEVVGPIGISTEAMSSAPQNVRFHGAISRAETALWYNRSDLFVLPTISDGFAITQIEAMAHGLPVVATPNCGEVVKDGVNGLIVPIRDSQALAEAVLKFVEDSNFYQDCSKMALVRSRDYSLKHLEMNLLYLEQELMN